MAEKVGTVVVTGGSSGLGAAVVRAVEKQGGTPLVLDLRPPPADVDHELVDLADARAAEAATAALLDRHPSVTGVVTAAGIDACGAMGDVDGAAWDRVVAVNLLGTAAVVRASLAALERNEGRLITVASTLGLRPAGDATAYCASKFGVVGFTRALALELAGRVGVTMLVPGGMATSFFDGRPEQYRPPAEMRLNSPDDVAALVVTALTQPPGCEVRELLVCPSVDGSWP